MNLLGQDVAPLGMGCWAIGGQFYHGDDPLGFAGVDDDTSTRTVHAALEAGIRVFDTAPVYGAGHSERVLGAALKHQSDAIIITKLGTAFDENTKQILDNETEAESVLPSIEGSLRRLKRDCIDIVVLHLNSLSLEVATPIFDAMEDARQVGKIRAYGWSTDFPASAAAMAGRDGFVAVEHAMNLFVDVPTMQRAIEEHDLAALIRSPLAMGVLTGKFDAASVMPDDDARSVNSDRRDYFRDGKVAAKHLENLRAIRESLQTGGRSLAQGALGWLMAKSGRNIPLPGARTVAQMQDNAGAIEFGPLPADVMADIESLIRRDPEGEPRAR